jgi:hypothetical protein
MGACDSKPGEIACVNFSVVFVGTCAHKDMAC